MEFPPEKIIVWTTDGSDVRKGTWFWNEETMQLEDGIWKGIDGKDTKVTHWLPLEDSPTAVPQLPIQEQKGKSPSVLFRAGSHGDSRSI
jgi:hypothetical protein